MFSQFSISHLLQDREWNSSLVNEDEEILHRDVVFNGKLSGSILAVKKKLRVLPYNYLRITFGPDIDYGSAELVKYTLERVIELAKENNSVYVQFNPFTWGEKNKDIIAIIEQSGFKKAKRYIYEATIMFDLDKTEEELFQDFEERGRKMVRQSEKRGITFSQEEVTIANLEKMYCMYEDTCLRTGIIPEGKERIIKTFLYFSERKKTLLFFAWYQNKEVCGILGYKCGNCLSLIYQGSDYSDDLRNRRPANHLYWKTMLWAKAQGYKWFDLAGVSLDAPAGSKSEGIYLFKRQFGGMVCTLPGNFEYVNRSFIKLFLDLTLPVYSRIALFLQRRKGKKIL
jgi:lipid II:glycine glycyltransferase (peptidoglycan interpeptide bridge formation enzyme)